MEESILQQRARIYRVATLAAGIFVHLMACWIVLSIGNMNLSTVEFVSLASLSAAGFLVLILLISLEWNLNLEDPDMSLPQMLWAVSVVIMTSHFVTELKAAVVLLGLAMVVIGANRLNRKEQIVFAVYSLTMYCMSMVILSQSSSLSTITEIVVMIAFSLILVCGPMLHRFEMSMLENVLVSKNKELSNALEQVKELAIKDDLTGAFNRRFLMDFLVQQKAQADRRDYVFTLCFIDLDFFKRVNDKFGHGTGDNVLRQFCEIAKSLLREVDCVARMGGEEFIMVLAGTPQQDALIVAERLAAEMADMVVSPNEPTYRITASLGVTEYRKDEDIHVTMERADRALYDAKRTGRNKTIIADLEAHQIKFG
jgi:diguanylate cyclase (GGDEF)-like protein